MGITFLQLQVLVYLIRLQYSILSANDISQQSDNNRCTLCGQHIVTKTAADTL